MHVCPTCRYRFPSPTDLTAHTDEGRGCPDA